MRLGDYTTKYFVFYKQLRGVPENIWKGTDMLVTSYKSRLSYQKICDKKRILTNLQYDTVLFL